MCIVVSIRTSELVLCIEYKIVHSILYILSLSQLCIDSGPYRFSYVDAFDFSGFFMAMLRYFGSFLVSCCFSSFYDTYVGCSGIICCFSSCSLGCHRCNSKQIDRSDAKFDLFILSNVQSLIHFPWSINFDCEEKLRQWKYFQEFNQKIRWVCFE